MSDNSGLVTSCTMRRPPCSGEMKLNFPITQMIGLAQPGAPDQIAVATAPGCRQFAVTPVPASFCASERVKSTLASLERA